MRISGLIPSAVATLAAGQAYAAPAPEVGPASNNVAPLDTDILTIGRVTASFSNASSMHLTEAKYTPFNQTTKILHKGIKPVSDDYPALPCDILFESDVPVTLRDGAP
ncbi:hypothetical protein BJX62DRAFT_243616 [Aspergillus germanicus]